MSRRLIIGISGASGAVYGIRLLEVLRACEVETHLVVSRAGAMTLKHETGMSAAEAGALADVVYPVNDIGAACASGSFHTLGMIVAPCSMRSLAEIATGTTSNLLTRSADVVLKERRRLVLMVRESPLSAVHIRNMALASEAGAVIAPPVPAFYALPRSIDELVDHTVGRALDLFGIEAGGVRRWAGLKPPGDAVQDGEE